MIKRIKNFLTKEDKTFIKDTVLFANFPYYLNSYTVKDKTIKDLNNYFFSHTIIMRPEYRKEFLFNSEHYQNFLSIVNNAFKKLKIKPRKYFRMSLNLNFNNGVESCPKHKDHDFKHKTLIVYLNDGDDNSFTCIKEKNKIKKIKPKKYEAVLFNDNLHWMFNPKKGIRLVLVTTFI